jgi:hypothetical protein
MLDPFDYVVFIAKAQLDPKYNTCAIMGMFQVPSGGLA